MIAFDAEGPAWRRLVRGQCDTLGEGALWDARHGTLWWVDILAPALNRLDLASGAIARHAMPAALGWVAIHGEGGLIGGFRDGVGRIAFDPLAPAAVTVAPRDDPEPHRPGNRLNDGKADAQGAVWFGTMDMAEDEACGALYRLGPDGAVRCIDEGYLVPNGPAFSPCGTWMYHNDTPRRQIYRYRLEGEGAVERTPFIAFAADEGYPDGLTVDAEGGLWVAHWGGARVSRFDPSGRRERSIALPAQQVTSLTFAGPQLDRLFATSAATGLAASAHDGALFEIDCGDVRGLAPGIYRG